MTDDQKDDDEKNKIWFEENGFQRQSDFNRRVWRLVKPFDAVWDNWKAWLIIGGVILAINSPRILAAMQALAGDS